MLRIVHISDWHGHTMELAPADIYVVTGDMLRNYPVPDPGGCSFNIDKRREKRYQGKYILDTSLRDCFGNKDAAVVVVRGNHDFISLSQWIGGDVYELTRAHSVIELLGVRFGGFRGVPGINGAWSDELSPSEDRDLGHALRNDFDFLVTHAPPMGILDTISKTNRHHLGLVGVGSWINKEMYRSDSRLKAHFFGHIHESFGFEAKPGVARRIIFSNAATGCINYVWTDNRLQCIGSSKLKPRT